MKKIMAVWIFLYSVIENLFAEKTPMIEHWGSKSRKRSIEQGNLDDAIKRSTDLQHFDENLEESNLESYENNETFDNSFDNSYEEAYEESLAEENLSSSENLTRKQRARVGGRMRKKKGNRGAVYSARKSAGKLTGSKAGIEGQLTIAITRDTYKIPYDLPVQVFNSLDGFCNNPLVNKYLPNSNVQFISGYVDATVTNFVFLFRNVLTGLTDTVTVSCSEIAYVKLLFATMVDRFRVIGGTIQLSDETKFLQFAKKFAFSEQNFMGKDGSNPLNMGSFVQVDQLRKELAKIKIAFPINKEKGFIFNCMYISGVVGTGYTLVTTFFLDLVDIKRHI